MAQTEESKNVFYLQQICSGLQQRVFKTLWGSVLIQTRLVHSYHTTDVQCYLCIHSKAASFLLPGMLDLILVLDQMRLSAMITLIVNFYARPLQ